MTLLRKMFLVVPLVLGHTFLMACDVCQKQQPRILKGITHGGGPQSDWDYVLVWCMVTIVAVSAVFSIRWMVRPGEKDRGHIKRSILNLN
jgi:hypothetical protein